MQRSIAFSSLRTIAFQHTVRGGQGASSACFLIEEVLIAQEPGWHLLLVARIAQSGGFAEFFAAPLAARS